MVFADPPYNVPISGHVSGLGRVDHDEFPMASGEMSEEAFTAFLRTSLEQIESHSSSGAIAFVWHGLARRSPTSWRRRSILLRKTKGMRGDECSLFEASR